MFDDYIKPDYQIQGRPTSLWLGTVENVDFDSKIRDEVFDTVIVGGGIAGLMTTYYLANAGQKVALLDMGEICRDVTGHTTAKVTSLHGQIYKYLIDNFNEETAALYGSAQEAAKEEIAKIVEEHNIDCEFERTNAYTFAMKDEMVEGLKQEVEAAKSIGLPAIWVDKIDLPIKNYGAVCFENQAMYHPVRFLFEISKIISEKGVKIFENTKATDIKEGEICEVTTEKGILKGKNVVIATHFPFYDKGGFFSKMEPHRSYVYAVRLKGETPEGLYYSQNNKMYTFRPATIDGKKYFLIGGESHKAGQGDEKFAYKLLAEFAGKNFDVDSFDYHWSTQDNFTFDRIPYIGKSPGSQKIFLATGFGGWGMTNGVLSAIINSDLILGKENIWAKIFNPGREKPIKSFAKLFGQNVNVAKKFFGGRIKGSHAFDLLVDILPNEGKVLEYGGEKVAAYRDEDGV